MEILLTVVVALLAIGVSWVSLRLVARLLDAGNPGWGACFLAMLLPQVVGLPVAAGLQAVGVTPFLALPVVLLVQIALVARLLDTSFLRALAITLVASFVAGVVLLGLWFALVFVLGVGALSRLDPGALLGGDTRPAPASGTEQRVDERPAVTVSGDDVIEGDMLRRPDGSVAGRIEDGRVVADDARQPPAEPAASRPPRPVRVEYGYRVVSPGTLGDYLRGDIRVTLRDGRVMEGVLTGIDGPRLQIERRLSGGTMSFTLKTGEVELVEAWDRLE